MTVPDGDLEATLRRELSAAAGQVEPGADALERIRARTGKRPPQPWLLSVLAGAVTRARYWVWRGHWARPDSLPRPSLASLPSWLGAGRTAGVNWLRPVAVLAGVVFVTTIALTVPPLRQAIVQVSNNVLPGQTSGGAGTGGKGSPSGNGGGGALTNGARNSSPGANGAGYASPGATATSQCRPASSAQAQSGSGSQIAAVVSSALPVTTATACPKPAATPTSTPSLTAPTTTPSLTPLTSPTTAPASSPPVSPTTSPPTSPPATNTGSVGPTGSASASP